jgi:hypothetical protein
LKIRDNHGGQEIPAPHDFIETIDTIETIDAIDAIVDIER